MKNALPPIADADSTILILGTMPGEQSLLHQQYYANKGNHFWKLMFSVLEAPFSADYSIRRNLLLENGIAVWDVLASCEREGSLDSRIKNEVANDFEKFFNQHPHINAVFFSSKAAEKYYHKYGNPKDGISYFTLPSPSGANASKSFSEKLELWKHLKKHLKH